MWMLLSKERLMKRLYCKSRDIRFSLSQPSVWVGLCHYY